MKTKLIILLFLASITTYAQYTLIPDVNFEKKLIALGIDYGNEDGKVLTSNVASLTSLNVSSGSITDLTGIQDFVGLTTLSCGVNQLATLDVSKNVALTYLECGSNKFTTLDVSKNISLTILSCNSNQLPVIDVSKNLALSTFICSNNRLTSLDVTKNVVLTYLDYNFNKLPVIDVSKNLSLSTLVCDHNLLTTIDVSKNVSLTTLQCNSNLLNALDVSKNTALTYFYCYTNKLTSLNLKNGKNNLLTNVNINLTGNANLSCIIVDDAAYSNTNWSNKKDATATFSTMNCSSMTKIPDTKFEDKLIALGIDTDGKNGLVANASIAAITSLDVSNSSIADLTGIQDFLSLKSLSCENNKLTTLDITKNIALTYLNCYGNQIAALDVTKNVNLTTFSCAFNQLSSLDVSKNVNLTQIICANNQLKILDVSKNVNLTTIYCNNNKLTILDFSKNLNLNDIDCQRNNLTSLDVAENKKLTSLNCYINQLTSLDVSKNVNLTHLDCNWNVLTAFDVSKNVNLIVLNCGLTRLSYLDVSKNVNLVLLYCDSNELTTLDISKNVKLEELFCDGNKLSILDVSKNINLKRFGCSVNLLTALDISKNINLNRLICNNNSLLSLNLRNGKNTIFDNYELDFRSNPNLGCIQVDNVTFSNNNWSLRKDATASFSGNCAIPIVLPSNNFTVESKGETCIGSNNGEINITAQETFSYLAVISGKSYPFTNNSLKVPSLAPGTFTVSITIPGENFEQNFTVTVPKGAIITGKSSVASNKVSVEIADGTAPYIVYVDGVEQFETTDSNFSVETRKGGLLEVKTAKACEGIYAEDIAGLSGAVSAYPNPTSGSFEIELPTSRKEVAISLYTLDGHLISNKTYTIENGKVQLSIANQATGVYVAKIELDTPDYLKIIKN